MAGGDSFWWLPVPGRQLATAVGHTGAVSGHPDGRKLESSLV